ncbi:AlpA family phage regulatory protein [Halomonas beimenensis]|uniref:AlpA family phage regulatory protein n=1 Tax=Halomonas beimenensis TaxID=475662 RepID=A0A291P8Z8_9GAMM|nr:hypothetical protein BEI_2406 [Halomonas beimenensis]
MSNDTTFKILRIKQLVIKLGIGRSSIYAKMNPRLPQYDPTFPKPVTLGARSKGWIEREIDEWLRSR